MKKRLVTGHAFSRADLAGKRIGLQALREAFLSLIRVAARKYAGAKALQLSDVCGTTKVVPFQNNAEFGLPPRCIGGFLF
jgi:hypothetical protein